MNKWQKEVLGNRIASEEQILKEVKASYKKALKDIDEKIAYLKGRTDVENMQSIIYQLDYQKSLKSQISAILNDLNTKQFDSVSRYLAESYQDGYIGTMYDLHKQGIPLTLPIDEKNVVKAVKTNTKLSKGLWGDLAEDNSVLQKEIRSEISRGLSQNFSYDKIANSIAERMNVAYNKTARIVRTESHRITQEATLDAQFKAREAGADVVKQWDASLDSRTRSTHRQLDGQIKELDEPFKFGGHEAMQPGGFGVAALDINCRCVIIQRAKWALDEEELETLKKRAEQFGLDKAADFEDYKKKYLKAADEMKKSPEDEEYEKYWKSLKANTEYDEIEKEWKAKILENYKNGYRRPILVDENDLTRVIDGNHTLQAFQELGIEPLIYKMNRRLFLTEAWKADDTVEWIEQMVKEGKATRIMPIVKEADKTPDYKSYLKGYDKNELESLVWTQNLMNFTEIKNSSEETLKTTLDEWFKQNDANVVEFKTKYSNVIKKGDSVEEIYQALKKIDGYELPETFNHYSEFQKYTILTRTPDDDVPELIDNLDDVEGTALFRGVNTNYGIKGTTINEMTRQSPYAFYGTGNFGDGIYFSTVEAGTERYGSNLIRAKLKPTAKVITWEELNNKINRLETRMSPEDFSIWAAENGYDAIIADVGGRGRDVQKDEKYISVINRSALWIEK